MNISIAIMAAGFGTRMRSATPKVLHTISGYPMLYHIIKEAKKISNDIHVILYHEASLIQEQMNQYFEDLHFILQDHKKFPGTGGALMGVKPKYEKLLVLSGDMPLVRSQDMEMFINPDVKIVLSSFKSQNPFGYGRVICDDGGDVLKIVEEKDANEKEKKVQILNGGIYCFDTQFLIQNLTKLQNNNAQKEYYITDLIAIAKAQNFKVTALEFTETTLLGVNSKVHLAQAEEHMQRRIKEHFMHQGVLMRLPESIYIESGVVIEGECIIENGVSLLKDARIINSHIKTNSVVEASIIENSSVGPMARIRPNSHLIDSHVGNFVELKNAKLRGVKAGHLSYLGDCSIDEGTNIGCGTITCNYDGKNKYQTTIGKNVFIGSDSQLIAPVTIEDDVIIASGTTITENIKKGSLAINRAPLRTIENFFYRFFNKESK
ncbi:MAG: bifunctional UDP-N-acetylglucosamine diphosphorylase/glucosamine-1-phosphate N-acetyltransferase GlmU [Sulfurospirillum sp.]|nr:bifunctional UDP-N-acetylglucosamine diphosphorylase/glucosamine-1-phosphate N-acetyltransferase GlmU [Sulfurospirillum sp.]